MTGPAIDRRLTHAALVLILLALGATIPAQQPDPQDNYPREHYTKHEFRIPMRDGARLFTAVYVPKDRSERWPIMLVRTPYSVSPYGADQYPRRLGPSEHFMKDRFIFVYQDVRGRYMSEGVWTEVRPHNPAKQSLSDVDESSDTYDTIDWLVKNVPNNNGRVGMWGISYAGFYVSAGLVDAHPALKAASPQAPVTDYYMGDDAFHNGAFLLAHNFGFYTAFGPRTGDPAPPRRDPPFDWGTPDGYDFYLRMGPLSNSETKYLKRQNPYWTLNLEHTTYDAFWQARAIWKHLKNIKPAVLTVGGWFDAEDLQGPLRTYRTIEQSSPGITNLLVMGPWTHGSWSRGDGQRIGNIDFATKTGAFYREHIEFPFFGRHLKDKAGTTLPEAFVFETGRNEWHELPAWPPANATATRFYLGPLGTLQARAPAEADAFDEYLSDPNNPVPLVGHIARGMPHDYMTEDQRFATTRPDVLVFETEVLEEDLRIAGPIGVTLHVSTTGTDADFVVKIIDVYPGTYPTPSSTTQPEPANAVKMGGYQQLVRGEPFRGKFRNSFEKPEPFVPGEPATISFVLPDVYHAFRRGHRLMVQVQSSWFPFIDRNPQKFMDIPKATDADFQKATHRVYRSSARPSSIELQVLGKEH